MTNQGAKPRPVRCQWVLSDVDGDQVVAHRRTTLNAGRQQDVWLYAAVPVSVSRQFAWRVEVINSATDEHLATSTLRPPSLIDVHDRAVGVVGDMSFGLEAYDQDLTQYEKCHVISDLKARHLPGRWYGLSMIEVLVWSDRGGSPDAPTVGSTTRAALREWIRRGGHLVVILPSLVDDWTSGSLADVLPSIEVPQTMSGKPPPIWLGEPMKQGTRIPIKRLEPVGDTTALLYDRDNEPVVVVGQYGFGRVTIVGVDLTDIRLARLRLPSPIGPLPTSETLWRRVFQWRCPIFRRDYVRDALARGALAGSGLRTKNRLGFSLIEPHLRMARTARLALTLAILCYITYWCVAGPIGFGILRRRHMAQHAWVVFTVVAWRGAPSRTKSNISP